MWSFWSPTQVETIQFYKGHTMARYLDYSPTLTFLLEDKKETPTPNKNNSSIPISNINNSFITYKAPLTEEEKKELYKDYLSTSLVGMMDPELAFFYTLKTEVDKLKQTAIKLYNDKNKEAKSLTQTLNITTN